MITAETKAIAHFEAAEFDPVDDLRVLLLEEHRFHICGTFVLLPAIWTYVGHG